LAPQNKKTGLRNVNSYFGNPAIECRNTLQWLILFDPWLSPAGHLSGGPQKESPHLAMGLAIIDKTNLFKIIN